MSTGEQGADPTAINIAKAIQDEVRNSTVILFGSRAAGTHREESDVDILLVYNKDYIAEISRAERAAKAYMHRCPPRLRVEIVAMEASRFHYCRRARNHVAGQAARKGIIMAPERLESSGNYKDEYPDSWPDVRERILAAHRNLGAFQREFEHPEGVQEIYGFHAQQAVENSLKAWISAAELTYARVHDLDELVGGILNHPAESTTLAGEQLKLLMAYTTFQDPGNPECMINWLTRYAVQYRYEGTRYVLDETERTRFKEEILLASHTFINRAHELTGTTNDDLQ